MGNVKQFESAGNSCYRGKFSKNFDQGKGNPVQVRGGIRVIREVLLYL